eukprot:7380700-Prymnesium_polylepis.2
MCERPAGGWPNGSKNHLVGADGACPGHRRSFCGGRLANELQGSLCYLCTPSSNPKEFRLYLKGKQISASSCVLENAKRSGAAIGGATQSQNSEAQSPIFHARRSHPRKTRSPFRSPSAVNTLPQQSEVVLYMRQYLTADCWQLIQKGFLELGQLRTKNRDRGFEGERRGGGGHRKRNSVRTPITPIPLPAAAARLPFECLLT